MHQLIVQVVRNNSFLFDHLVEPSDDLQYITHMLHPNCALQARYFDYDIIRIQIMGETKYTLFHPKNLERLQIYPHSHPSSHQSQVNICKLSSSSFFCSQYFGQSIGINIYISIYLSLLARFIQCSK